MKMTTAILVLALLATAIQGDELMCSSDVSSQCPSSDPATPVYLADPNDCGAYCECSNGSAWRFKCSPGTLFDDSQKYCNWADFVDCGSRPN